ncbi:predicted protein [Phaeodactylum tricornutum CCAP 1055/1]|jgi:ribosomal protein S18 acetylase RimI-like enzyme|uniref:N-acetyltransferase domain-containing protein n=1 Tax=Phaeodactylum tricornutum (strain CCAP 1055/1) TaxID=556484 RepID=B7FVP5_PHATC|nr:predicted protein [Phaeodactylum tricornutum CCAP 1055/1]EEC49665.1 predicted protein [Phaeodactylum tricornutum CCAP 1055/1]|eukprot:XP_002178967.1 predicted protein [Phaeodactylum tricornutum CCAP 1055/1]
MYTAFGSLISISYLALVTRSFSPIANPRAVGSSAVYYQHQTEKISMDHAHARTEWVVRPATLDDANATARLLKESYSSLLIRDYDPETLAKALPLITSPRPELLTCGTWYVVQHPAHGRIVGCGGWTKRTPAPETNAAEDTQGNEGQSAAYERTLPLPHIRHFATDPLFLRQGVARAVWDRIWQDLSNDLGPDVVVEVLSTLTGEVFYKSLGFSSINRTEVSLGPDCLFPIVVMRRHPM